MLYELIWPSLQWVMAFVRGLALRRRWGACREGKGEGLWALSPERACGPSPQCGAHTKASPRQPSWSSVKSVAVLVPTKERRTNSMSLAGLMKMSPRSSFASIVSGVLFSESTFIRYS